MVAMRVLICSMLIAFNSSRSTFGQDQTSIQQLVPNRLIVQQLTAAGNSGIDFFNVSFEHNSSQLTADAKNQLIEIGHALRSPALKSLRFQVEGHTNQIGDAEFNQQLSLRRARSVTTFLIGIFNIDEDRLIAIGKGEMEPINGRLPNDPANRRVRLVRI